MSRISINLGGKNESISHKVVKKDIKFKDKLVYLPGGEFLMGTDDEEGFPSDGEGPVRKVKVDPFYIDSHTVSNAEFNQFVIETGYKTEAEKFGWSYVFYKFVSPELKGKVQQVPGIPWWLAVEGLTGFNQKGQDLR